MSAGPALLVVEDDVAVREGLVAVLRAEGFLVQACRDGLDAVRAAAAFRPDLVVLDVGLPGGLDGLAVARRLRQSSDVPIVFLTGAGSDQERLAGFAAGADDYVVKPFLTAELVARVRALLRRSGVRAEDTIRAGDLLIDLAARCARRDDTELALTPTEFDLLVALARNRGKAMSKTALLGQVWGYAAADPNLVESQVSKLRRKLEAHGPGMIRTVRGSGYMLTT